MNRREFCKFLFLLPTLSFSFNACQAKDKKLINLNPEEVLFQQKIKWAINNSLEKKPLNIIILELAKSFLNAPYEAGTLDLYNTETERLIINLHSFDCFTFLETVLALARCIKKQRINFADYKQELEFIRYRNGKLNNYESRLHYFSEWILNGSQKRIVKLINGSDLIQKPIFYLSQNSPKANNNQLIQDSEKKLSSLKLPSFNCLSLQNPSQLALLQEGDIIGFTSNIEGLDINHVGFLIKKPDQTLSFIHASSRNQKVEIYKDSLANYCSSLKSNSGILVARPF
jgi:Protein of unknown function (DUF1460)